MSKFKEGYFITELYLDAETTYIAGQNCDFIQVVTENGQMAGVPWFEVWYNSKLLAKYNGAMMLGVA